MLSFLLYSLITAVLWLRALRHARAIETWRALEGLFPAAYTARGQRSYWIAVAFSVVGGIAWWLIQSHTTAGTWLGGAF